MTNPPDRWSVEGEAYEAYMGRWSRPLAGVFAEWLDAPRSAHWLEVGCGTGALTAATLDHCEPASIVACDPSAPFVEHARKEIADPRVSFLVAGADALPSREGGFDGALSGLVFNFLPDPARSLASIRERLHPGGVVAAYVWDYAGGMEFLRIFWDEAVAADPRAASADEGRRFPLCRPEALAALFREGGLEAVTTAPLEIATVFADFDDYWVPFVGGPGPAPGYLASLDAAARDSLRERLRGRLRPDEDGRIRLHARAFAVRGVTA